MGKTLPYFILIFMRPLVRIVPLIEISTMILRTIIYVVFILLILLKTVDISRRFQKDILQRVRLKHFCFDQNEQ